MEWFSHFRQREDREPVDIVLLQEIRVVEGEANKMNALSCAVWSFKAAPTCRHLVRSVEEVMDQRRQSLARDVARRGKRGAHRAGNDGARERSRNATASTPASSHPRPRRNVTFE
ncbi:hypothetical protein CCR75_002386 [Bremia lactucae]|uniref:Uncharacterized protein n=1 Tax=Bremia lactucae TaxID=4779 RepID=A0A976FMR1_BRELC|nr:hypothetical protein CCR75_002386 [Bremia lactucae]